MCGQFESTLAHTLQEEPKKITKLTRIISDRFLSEIQTQDFPQTEQ
jgi:hypothetical protein